jgi:hypothetical protein
MIFNHPRIFDGTKRWSLRAYLSTTGDDKYVGTSGGGGGGGSDNEDPHPTNFINLFIYYGDDNEGKSLVPQLCFTMVAPGWCCPKHTPPPPPTPSYYYYHQY